MGQLRSWEVEQLRRSVAMLPPGAPGLRREEALDVLGQLREALVVLERQRVAPGGPAEGGPPG